MHPSIAAPLNFHTYMVSRPSNGASSLCVTERQHTYIIIIITIQIVHLPVERIRYMGLPSVIQFKFYHHP